VNHKYIKLSFSNALAMLGLLFFSGCLSKEGELIHISGRTMGTHYNVKFYSSKDLDSKELAQEEIDTILKKVNKEMSTYLKESEISYFNNSDRIGWISISKSFFKVTEYALNLAKNTEGRFDPTIGPLVNLWGFGPGGERKVPKEEEIKAAQMRVGFDKILLNKEKSEIKKKVPGIYLDLSSLAKGFGVDQVSDFLESKKIQSYMVEIGGEVRTLGKKIKGGAWRIAIEAPHPENSGEQYQKILDLNKMSLATSGNYRNFFMENGQKFSHTLDSKTGRPVAHTLASVSVAHPESCMKADALATALMAMGVEKGLDFAQKEGIAAYFVFRDDGQEGQPFVTKETTEFSRLFGPKKVDKVSKVQSL